MDAPKTDAPKIARVAAAFLLAATLPGHAASPPQAGSNDVIEEILVTGSRIARSGMTTATPVTMLDAQTIAYKGDTKIADLVNQLPALRTTQTAANTNFNEQEAGAAFLDLRGLGIDRTLVLIDGRRQVAGRLGSAAIDTNTIPVALIERVEVITGGASAIYGADAVSGVVNFIMKDDFEGLQVDGQFGITDENDGENYNVSITGGTNIADGRGNIYFNATYDENKKVVGIDRGHANKRIRFATNPADTGPGDGIPNQILFENTGFISTPPNGLVNFPTGDGATNLGEAFGGPFIFDDNGNLIPQNRGQLVEPFLSIGGDDATNLSRFDLLQVPTERTLISGGLRYDLTDQVRFFASGTFSQTKSRTAGQTSFTLPSVEPVFILPENPFVPDELRDILVSEDLDGFFVSRTNIDHGQDQSKSDRDMFQLIVGFEGEINDNLDFTVHYQYGETDVTTQFINRQIPFRFQQALDAVEDPETGGIVCRDPSGGCVPVSVLGPNAATPEALAFFMANFNTNASLDQEIFNATLTGDTRGVFELPAGPIGFAAGLEYREESASSTEGFLRNSGNTFAAPPIGDISGDFDVFEVFGEVAVPLVRDVAYVDELNFESAVRWADYSTVGSAVTWKFGGDWVINSDVRVRAVRSRAVRAPNIGELFAPGGVENLFLIDPCDAANLDNGSEFRRANCAALGLSPDFLSQSLNRTNTVITGGNPDLDEEEADTFTIGAVFTPTWLPGFSLTVDYWDIEIEDAINAFPAQSIVFNCVDAASIDNPFCAQVTRQANGNFDEIESTRINVAKFEASGWDFEAAYFMSLDEVTSGRVPGNLDLRLIATKLNDLTFFGQAGDPGEKRAGELGNPEFAMNIQATYQLGAFTFFLEERMQGEQKFDNAEGPEARSPSKTDRQWYTDIQLRYQATDGIDVFFGVDNLFDNNPPRLARIPEIRSFTGDAIGFDQIGRFFRLGASVRL